MTEILPGRLSRNLSQKDISPLIFSWISSKTGSKGPKSFVMFKPSSLMLSHCTNPAMSKSGVSGPILSTHVLSKLQVRPLTFAKSSRILRRFWKFSVVCSMMVVLSSASDSFFPVSRADSHAKKLLLAFACTFWGGGGSVVFWEGGRDKKILPDTCYLWI
jgi:hypothetical protein